MGVKRVRRALIIFIKNPVKGKVKTRLASGVGEDQALAIYNRLLNHTRSVSLEIEEVNRYLYYLDEIKEDDWYTDHFIKRLQSPGDLGNKMMHSFAEVLQENDQAVIIGSDCAQLTAAIIRSAFEILENKDFAIGPTLDGGYYLLGMTQVHPFLFQNMIWSVPDVFNVTINRMKQASKSYGLTPRLSDIDHKEDWELYGLDS